MKAPVSIVIPVHNRRELLAKLLASIARQTATPQEVIVVDNGSSDGAPEVAREYGTRVIPMGRNAGFAAAVNRGIREAAGEGIALINSDVELDPRWLELLWGSISGTGSHFGAGMILQAGSREVLDGSFDLICRGGSAWRAGAGYRINPSLAGMRKIRFCPATAAIFRSELFRRVGLFDESFGSYLEDVDMGLRCAAAGLTGVYVGDAMCWHLGSATFGRWDSGVVRLIARNQVFLIGRHYSRELIFRWLWPIVVAQVLWGVLAARHGCTLAFLRGKTEGLRRLAAVRSGSRAYSSELESILIDSERQIHEFQSEAGFDWYWRLYFRLTGFEK